MVVVFDVTGEATVCVMDWSITAEGGGVTLGAVVYFVFLETMELIW